MDSDKTAATKERILAGALRLFNAQGVGGISALDVATALGISPGHLYYHFKGKPELLDVRAADRAIAALGAKSRSGSGDTSSPKSKTRRNDQHAPKAGPGV